MSTSGKKESKLKLVVAGENREASFREVSKPRVESSRVLKAGDLNHAGASVRVSPYRSNPILPQLISPHESVESLRQNLTALNQLHSRLRFMLKELEELI